MAKKQIDDPVVLGLLDDWSEIFLDIEKRPCIVRQADLLWFDRQNVLQDKDMEDLGVNERKYIRSCYEELVKEVPRCICKFLYDLITWWQNEYNPSVVVTKEEKMMYITIAKEFPISDRQLRGMSHFTIVEYLEEAYKFMVDEGDEKIPGISVTMGARERRNVRQKWFARYLREHPEIKKEYEAILDTSNK